MRYFKTLAVLMVVGSATAQNSPVTNLSSLDGYLTISEAIAGANEGDTLQLAAISFNESLILSTPIVLQGATAGGTILDIRSTNGYGIGIESSSVHIRHLTVLSNSAHLQYAIHSEPDITGIVLDNVSVVNNATSGIDLNGLSPGSVNAVLNCSSVGSGSGFGLALSSCQNVNIENFTSSGNGFGDIGILESAYSEQTTQDLLFTGEMNLLGQNSDGVGAIVVQSEDDYVDPGTTNTFDIDMQSGLIHQIAAMTDEYDGSLLGYILCTPENVAAISESLSSIPGVNGLYARNIDSGAIEVWPGMELSEAIQVTPAGGLIQIVYPGDYDSDLVTVDKPISIIGPNAGISAASLDRDIEARFTGGFAITSSDVFVDGIRIQNIDTDADGLTIAAGVSDIEVNNTVFRGNFEEQGDLGQVGLNHQGGITFNDCSFRNWPVAVEVQAGTAIFNEVLAADNREAFAIRSNSTTPIRLELNGGQLINAGADAIVVTAAGTADSLVVLGAFGNLHRHALKFDVPCGHRIEGNNFINSEEQVIGLTTAERIALCEDNSFSNPAISIEACTNSNASNYEPCATINTGCEYLGCTDQTACNYVASANTDDGSCEYTSCGGCLNPLACNYDATANFELNNCEFLSCRGCTNPDAQNFDSNATIDDGSCRIVGCTNPEAFNYNSNANIDNGSCLIVGCVDATACNYEQNANVNNGTCEFTSCAGCMDERACNYDNTATLESNSCDFVSCRGCTNPSAFNYDNEATIDDGSCRILGCTDSNASNYDAEANIDDNTCLYSGCTDSGACNFDVSASSDDGSCEYTSCAGCAIQGFCNYDPNVSIHDGALCDYLSCCGDSNADNYDPAILPQLTYGCIYGPSAGMVFLDVCNVPFACNYLVDGPCEFDSCAGCTDSDACNYDASASLSTSTCTYPVDEFGVENVDCNGDCLNDINSNGICDEEESPGCSDNAACNYNPAALGDDGSCEYTSCEGCTDSAACNYDNEANINTGCDYSFCSGCLDSAACNYDETASISAPCSYPSDVYESENVDCDGNCINDSNEDGTCDEDEVPGCTNAAACNFSEGATENDGSCEFTSCSGCTDVDACNYDSALTINDGSCDYASCAGCLDPAGCNYVSAATISLPCTYPSGSNLDCAGECNNDVDGDGVCDENEIEGCTDLNSCNYSPEATDDLDCEYQSCAGCTNPGACNYVPGATLNDGSCDYFACQGCTDPPACNYAPDATVEDGSCIYPLDIFNDPSLNCGGTCVNDADEDGICDDDELQGCLEPGACNYNPGAEISNGTCDYESCQGCTDSEACNYNEYATVDNGSCTNPLALYGSTSYDCFGNCYSDADEDGVCDADETTGCTDETACNFDSEATEDDGSCDSPADLYGSEFVDCDGVCLNDADEDGICDEDEVSGCTDDDACNYNALATDEDGSCQSPEDIYGVDYVDCDGVCLNDMDGDGICDVNEACIGDFNEDGLRSAADILTILAAYGCMEDCGDKDLNGDGLVTSSDILDMLSVFGTYCE